MTNDLGIRSHIEQDNVDYIIQGSIDANGNNDYLTASSLTLTLNASSADPFIYNINGRKYKITSNKTVSATNNANNFVTIDNTGTLAVWTTPCTYAYIAPVAPATNDHWYDLSQRQMKQWSGTVWNNVARIFVGYVRADAGAINSAIMTEAQRITPFNRYDNSDGSDGFVDQSSGTLTIDGEKEYTFVIIRGTGTINHSLQSTTPQVDLLYIRSQSGLVILANGIDLNGRGVVGGVGAAGTGGNGTNGAYGGGGGGGGGGANAGGTGGAKANAIMSPAVSAGGGGAAGAALGGAGGNGTASLYSSLLKYLRQFWLGSPGGGGGGDGVSAGGNGGRGGGACYISVINLVMASSTFIRANGQDGVASPGASRGAGGGGGGGCLPMDYYNAPILSGTISASGGTGGTGGVGAGAGGNGAAGLV